MNLRQKILTGFTVLVGMVLLQGIVEYRRSVNAVRDVRQLRLGSLQESMLANQLVELVSGLELHLTPPLTEEARPDIQANLDALRTVAGQALVMTAKARSYAEAEGDRESADTEKAEVQLLEKLAADADVLAARWSEVEDAVLPPPGRQERIAALQAFLRSELKPPAIRYRDHSLTGLTAYSLALEGRALATGRFLLWNTLLAVAFATFASVWVIRTFMRPLEGARSALKAIASGDPHRRLDASGNDEFAVVARAFNQLLDQQEADARARTEIARLAEIRTAELDNFIELSMDILAIGSPGGHFTRVNSAFAHTLGIPAAEILRRPWIEFVHPDDRETTRQAGARLQQGEPVCNFENRYRCADGTWKWLSWQVRPNAASGQYFAVARDVTEKRQADQALRESREQLRNLNENLEQQVIQRTARLRESESRFRALVEGVKDYAIIMLDPEGRITNWNSGAERIKGYTAKEIIGQSVHKFYTPEDIALGKPAEGFAIARAEGRHETTGWRMRKDGGRFFANAVITAVYDEAGVLQGFAKITRDITEQHHTAQALRQQQELLRLLMDNLAEGVVACGADGKLTFFNKVAREWHGGDVNDHNAERWAECFDLFEPDGTTLLQPENIPLLRAYHGERVRSAEMVIARKGASPRYIEASGDAIYDSSGQRIGAVVVMHDLTERRQAERQNLRGQRLESIGTLAGGIAHDLNNALAPILMGVELIKLRFPGSDKMLGAMEASARRGAGMVKQLLTFAKGVDGRRVALDPKHLIREIESLVESTFPKNIVLQVSLDHGNGTILGDATQIHQVLLNLCVNARDAMPAGGTLAILTDLCEIDALYASSVPGMKLGRYLRLRVSDTGTGIPPDVIDRIFEPFFSTKPPDQGTGLGLSTVIGIVRSHGGVIQVYSPPPGTTAGGTQFSVYLPVAANPDPASAEPRAANAEVAGRGRTILVIDDEPSVRNISRDVLDSLGFKVITANDGEEALQQIVDHQGRIALIITDLHMPRMNGLSFVENAREALPGIPIIVSSGRIEKDDADRLHALNVHVILHKPYSQRELVTALQQVFATNSLHPFRTPSRQ